MISTSFCSASTWALTVCDLPDQLFPLLVFAIWPCDINMQILADNNAKPHNQQIINSHPHCHPLPLHPHPPDFLQPTPVPHVEKSSNACCKTSSLLRAVKPVIDYSRRAPTCSLASDNLHRGQWKYAAASGNMESAIPAYRLGEEDRCRSFNHQASGSAPWSWPTRKLFSSAQKSYCFGTAALTSDITTHWF